MLRLFSTNTVPHRHAESTTWLELFFDLVYVAVLVEMGNRLSHDISAAGMIQYLFLFIIVWWSWLEKVLFARFFSNDDIGQRMLTFLYMAFIGLMAFNIHDMTGSTAVAFLLAYAASKAVLVIMYVKAGIQFPQYRRMAMFYAGIFSVAAIAWLLIAIFSPTYIAAWALVAGFGILMGAILPILKDRKLLSFDFPPMKKHYMRHRFGELTIIVLGEFFIKVISSSEEREIFPVTVLFFILLLSISTSLWWLYFDHQEHSTLSKRRSRLEIWIYIHYPLLAVITAYGVAGTKIMALIPGEALSDPKRWLFCGALAVAVASTAVIEWASREKTDTMSRGPQIYQRLIGALLLLLLALLGGSLSVPLLVIIVVGIIITLVGLDISWRMRNPVAEPA